jgi:hypothetical protein
MKYESIFILCERADENLFGAEKSKDAEIKVINLSGISIPENLFLPFLNF